MSPKGIVGLFVGCVRAGLAVLMGRNTWKLYSMHVYRLAHNSSHWFGLILLAGGAPVTGWR